MVILLVYHLYITTNKYSNKNYCFLKEHLCDWILYCVYRSGVIQEGDRVICINGQSTLNRTIDELIQRYLEPTDFEKKYFRVQSLTLLIQYTVADSVVPATGIFDVKLIRRSVSLGINLQGELKQFFVSYIISYLSRYYFALL